MESMLSKLKKNKHIFILSSCFALYWFYLRFAILELSKAHKHLKSYNSIIKMFCKKFGYPYPSIVAAIIMVESYGNPTSKGGSGEFGLMQIMPRTFEMLDKIYHFNFELETLYDPLNNIVVGIHLLKYLKSRGLSIKNQIKAYNVGEDLKPADKAKIYYDKVMKWI
jgi:soluble lytic murein transglycosylase-like protein